MTYETNLLQGGEFDTKSGYKEKKRKLKCNTNSEVLWVPNSSRISILIDTLGVVIEWHESSAAFSVDVVWLLSSVEDVWISLARSLSR